MAATAAPPSSPAQADASLLLDRLTDPDPDFRMPPEGSPLTDAQIALVRDWIDQGAIAPPDESPEPDPRDHWAFRKAVRPDLPTVRDPDWNRHPIDAFLAVEHDRLGLTPLPLAEPHVLLRRLYLDLIGLPPTRAELHAFLADPSEEAYRRTVDRLLASPQYGERWARHWMDVWRYSDWYGRRAVPDVTNSYAMIWRWRDWIVRSLNADKPYSRMVLEMLAADEINPNDRDTLVATGFLVRNFYRWNYNLWMKDNVEHTAKAFLGLTINCAHCHDHKYDPIKHEDYFAFRAFFEPLEIRHDRVPGEPDPGPYPKYEYGKAYKPITSGLVRIFDEKLDAETYLYTRGEARNVVPDRPPIPPGVPAFLSDDDFHVEPIDLPPEASYPGLQDFVRREEIAQREAALSAAEQELNRTRDQVASARQGSHAEPFCARRQSGVPRRPTPAFRAVGSATRRRPGSQRRRGRPTHAPGGSFERGSGPLPPRRRPGPDPGRRCEIRPGRRRLPDLQLRRLAGRAPGRGRPGGRRAGPRGSHPRRRPPQGPRRRQGPARGREGRAAEIRNSQSLRSSPCRRRNPNRPTTRPSARPTPPAAPAVALPSPAGSPTATTR